MRAKNLAARQSGRSEASEGRRTPPASTSSPTPFSRRIERPAAAAPIRHQACGTPSTVSGSAAPSRARTKTSRPAARQASMSRRGSPPSPATMPSLSALSAISLLRLADGAARIGADEGDDVLGRADSGKSLGGLVDAVAQGPVGEEQKLVGVSQTLDVLAAEAAALNADDVEPGQPRPVAHHLAVRDHVA